MATNQATRRPPTAGRAMSVRVDQQLADDLAILMQPGKTASAAIKDAVETVASIYRNAWANGYTPEGEVPSIVSAVIQPTPTDEQAPA